MDDSNRRESERVAAQTRCWCEGGAVTLYSVVDNVSEGGLFVRTFAPLEPGTAAKVRLDLGDGGRRIEADAKVVWRRARGDGNKPPGMGLQFVGVVEGVATRMLLHFGKGGFPAYETVDEEGMPQPCALGIPWVNEDTQRTLAKLHIPPTDPWGRPLPEPEAGRGGSGSR